MAVGMVGFVGWGVESSGGGSTTGAYSAAITEFIPFVSETLTLQRNDLPDPSIWTNFDERRMYNGLQRVEGGMQFVMHPILSGHPTRICFDVTTSGRANLLLNGVDSHAGIIGHRFVTGQTQFQAGSGSDLPTATIEVNRGPIMGSGSSFMYYNVSGNVWELTIEAGQFARLNVEMLGRDYGGKIRSAPSYLPAEAYLWNTASVSADGVAKPIYEALTIRMENNLEAVPTLDGRLRSDLVKRNDFRRVNVNGTVSFRNFEDYDGFVNGSETNLVATFVGKQVGTGGGTNYQERLNLQAPRFRYSTFPVQIGGPGRNSVGFTGRGMIDQTSLYSLQVTLVNTRVSNYAVNTTA